MATSRRTTQTLYDSFSKAAAPPRYICRSCRNHIQLNMRQHRTISNSASSSHGLRRKTWQTEVHRASSRSALFATASSRCSNTVSSEELAEDKSYVEAETWDGLEHVGHQGHWKDIPAKPQDRFEPWLVRDTDTTFPNRTELLAMLYVAVVDVLAYETLKTHEKDLKLENLKLNYAYNKVKIALSPSGTISHLDDPEGILGSSMSDAVKGSTDDAQAVELPISEIKEQLDAAKFDFTSKTTFTILKHFSRLISMPVPDPILNTVVRGNKSMAEFVSLLDNTKPKPQKTAEILIAKQAKALNIKANADPQTLTDITKTESSVETSTPQPKRKVPRPLGPNVMVLSRRETPVDKEKEIGRWKVIARELQSKGLPVLGHKDLAPQGQEWNRTTINTS
ncbi:uncharacterized protein PV06_00533 [Exophiala oligosperma]|uniref:Uncharacterized protein n=1 Tax=Exophiala oligosperma TaxID=215243 RepID=A0A0D2CDB1_9EURO|nr:uncharacterized protein PV06_00533 [Exophiala oligosperma]KIW47877.1 hypothetical protein PV06_00533 [Exophiala oligosperma]